MPLVVSQLIGIGPTYTIDDYSRAFYAMGAMVALCLLLTFAIRPVARKTP